MSMSHLYGEDALATHHDAKEGVLNGNAIKARFPRTTNSRERDLHVIGLAPVEADAHDALHACLPCYEYTLAPFG
jgi:hypothetical protein